MTRRRFRQVVETDLQCGARSADGWRCRRIRNHTGENHRALDVTSKTWREWSR